MRSNLHAFFFRRFFATNHIPHSIKKIAVDILYWAFRFLIASKKLLFFLAAGLARGAWRCLKFVFRRPAIFLYRISFGIRSHIENIGITIRHPLLYLISGKFLSHGLVIILGATVMVASVNVRTDETEILAPQNILSSFIETEGRILLIEEGTESAPTSPHYLPIAGIATEPNVQDETRAVGSPADIALRSGALIKPTLPSAVQPSAPAGGGTPASIITYTVASGDTLGGIARRFGLSLSTILWANSLTERSTLRIGQRLTIPPTDGVLHRVRRGDTLGSIARNYSSEVEKIIKANSLSGDRIAVDTLLIIPGGVVPRSIARENNTIIGRIQNVVQPRPAGREPSQIPATISGASGMIWPTTARRITQYFSWRHSGLDIAGPTSNTIIAADDGVVEVSGWQNGYGYTVVLRHPDGKRTRYGHASKLYVSRGESVKRGEVIAQVGSTGRSTGPHVHFEVIINGRFANPLSYVRL